MEAGPARVLNDQLEWGVLNIGFDVNLVMNLTVQSLIFNVTGFFKRPLGFTTQGVEFIQAEFENVDAFLFAPVMAGMWKQHELWDGTYSLDDLLDAHEVMAVKHENERRNYESMRKEV